MLRRCWILAAAGLLAGCSGRKNEGGAPGAPVSQPARPAVETDTRPVIVAFGDSLTSGHGVEPGQSYPDHLQRMLDERGYRYRVVNQGISGDTTSGGVARIGAALLLEPKIVILELGANDGLRGLPVTSTRENLSEMIGAFRKAGARVVLAGMTLPRNYGKDYISAFEQVFRDMARREGVTLIPFLLDGVAMNPQLMQSDALHPNAEGCRVVAQNVFKTLEPLLEK
jgi:acyl-CoA thioesterase-1